MRHGRACSFCCTSFRGLVINDPAADLVVLAPTIAEVNLAHLRHNAQLLRKRAAPAELIAVVKADAYGHGAVRIVRTLIEEGIRYFAVANVPEALRLREEGIRARLLVFGAPLPEHLPWYAAHDLDIVVPSRALAEALAAWPADRGKIRAHLKIDTGMSRLGVTPAEAPGVLQMLRKAKGVRLEGLWTHYASADEPGNPFTARQTAEFAATVQACRPESDVLLHAANSAALLLPPENYEASPHTLVRPGLALYGVSPVEGAGSDLLPVMRLITHVTHVKTIPAGTGVSYGQRWHAPRATRLATIGVGYADGYFRALTGKAEVGIRGRRYPVVGTICMDMCMVDLGEPETAPDVQPGEQVVLFGTGGPGVAELAELAGTIPYEILCAVSPRVPRLYLDGDGVSGVYDPAG